MCARAAATADLGNPEVENPRVPQAGHVANGMNDGSGRDGPKRAGNQEDLRRHDQVDYEIAICHTSEHLRLC